MKDLSKLVKCMRFHHLGETQVTFGLKSNTSSINTSKSSDFVFCDNSDKSSKSKTYDFASCVSSPKTNDSFSIVNVKILPKYDVKDPSPTNGFSSCSFMENVKPPRNLYNFPSFVLKATSIPTGSRNSSGSISTGRSIPVASRNRPASIHAGRHIPAGRFNKPAPLPAGRSVLTGWTNHAARPFFRPVNLYFDNVSWPGIYNHMSMNEGRWGSAVKSSAELASLEQTATSKDVSNPFMAVMVYQKPLGYFSSPMIHVSRAGLVTHPPGGCSNNMTGILQLLRNFVEKFMGTDCFGNDHFTALTGSFCDGDLEVVFRSNTCYVRNLKGDDLLTGSRVGLDPRTKVYGMSIRFAPTGWCHIEEDVAKSSTKNLIPIPNECMVVSENGSQFIEPVNGNSSDSTIISNPLSDVESNSNESTSNHDNEKSDYLDEFYGPFIPIHILEKERIRREHADYINRMEMLFTINSRPHNLMNDNTNIESFYSFPIPNQESDPHQEEIDVVSVTNDVLLPSDDDSDEEVDVVGDLRVDNFIQNSEHEYSESEDFDFDNPLLALPPPKPLDTKFYFKIDF
nr:hypothetical protein [Tanacetum cinerariifolium]